jgi:MFS family permease
MDHDDLHLFLSIAEIAGVFVGFGALISVAQDQPLATRAQLRGVVMAGLGVLVGALLPVTLARFGLVDRALWGWASAAFLAVIWVIIVPTLRHPEARAWSRADVREHPVHSILFWVFLEVPIQVSLILALLSVIPELDTAFYVTALVLNLCEAAYLLARVVLARSASTAG